MKIINKLYLFFFLMFLLVGCTQEEIKLGESTGKSQTQEQQQSDNIKSEECKCPHCSGYGYVYAPGHPEVIIENYWYKKGNQEAKQLDNDGSFVYGFYADPEEGVYMTIRNTSEYNVDVRVDTRPKGQNIPEIEKIYWMGIDPETGEIPYLTYYGPLYAVNLNPYETKTIQVSSGSEFYYAHAWANRENYRDKEKYNKMGSYPNSRPTYFQKVVIQIGAFLWIF